MRAEDVRLARESDAAAVARLICAFRDYYGEATPEDAMVLATVRTLLGGSSAGHSPSAEFLLASDPPLGFAQLRFRLSVWTGSEDAWLEDVFFLERARGRGLGRALTEACVERARERGCSRIQLDANERNAGALALYRSLGFESGSPGRWQGARDLYLTKWL